MDILSKGACHFSRPSCWADWISKKNENNSHTGPVWQVAWAHPKYGHILASCSYDGKVLIWKEQQGGSAAGGWIKIKEHTLHTASGNLFCFPQ